MKPLSKDVENIIEESKYQVRIEIAEKCLMQKMPSEFIMNVCSLTKEEVTTILNDLKNIKSSKRNLITDQRQEMPHQSFLETNQSMVMQKQTLEEMKAQRRELKQIERQKKIQHEQEKKIKTEQKREIAAENTRLLMEKMKEKQNNNKLLNIDKIDSREKQIERLQRRRELKASKDIHKNATEKDNNDLSKEQKMIASVGKCYLRGLNEEQAVIFSKESKEDVKRIYNSFKNK